MHTQTDRAESRNAANDAARAEAILAAAEAVRFFHDGPAYPSNKIIQNDTMHLYISRSTMPNISPSGRRVLRIRKARVAKSCHGKGFFGFFMQQLKDRLHLTDILVVDCAGSEEALDYLL